MGCIVRKSQQIGLRVSPTVIGGRSACYSLLILGYWYAVMGCAALPVTRPEEGNMGCK